MHGTAHFALPKRNYSGTAFFWKHCDNRQWCLFVTLGPLLPSVLLQVSWSPDSSQLISASGDKTVKLWDVGTSTALTTFNIGADVMDQQLGCLWQKDHLLSISLSGYINYLDKSNPDRPFRTIKVSPNLLSHYRVFRMQYGVVWTHLRVGDWGCLIKNKITIWTQLAGLISWYWCSAQKRSLADLAYHVYKHYLYPDHIIFL